MSSDDNVFVLPDETGITHLCHVALSSGTVILMASAQSVICAYSAVIMHSAEMSANESKSTSPHTGLAEYLGLHVTQENNFAAISNKKINNNNNDITLLAASMINESSSKISITSGYITSLHAMLLPGSTNTAIGVACTNTGCICVFHVNGVHLSKIRETTLRELCPRHSLLHFTCNGATDEQVLEEHIVDGQFSVDPLGNLEFVAIATAHHVWCVNTELLLQNNSMGNENSVNDDEEGEQLPQRQQLEQNDNDFTQENVLDDMTPCNNVNCVVTDNKTKPLYSIITNSSSGSTQPLYKDAKHNNTNELSQKYSTSFHMSFSHSCIVKLLVPQHHRVAFSIHVALLVILQNGEIHYVQRTLRGGSLELLRQYHNAQLHPITKQKFESSYGNNEECQHVKISSKEDDVLWRLPYLRHRADIPLVVYQYEHCPVMYHMTESKIERTLTSNLESNNNAYHWPFITQRNCNLDSLLMINDAMLKYDEECDEMNLVVTGVLLSAQAPLAPSLHCTSNVNKNTPLSALSLCASRSAMCTRNGWCALITNVIPEHHHVEYGVSNSSHAFNEHASLTNSIYMYATTLLHPPTRPVSGNNTHSENENSAVTLFSVPDTSLTTIVNVEREARVLLMNGNNIYLCDLQELRNNSESMGNNRQQRFMLHDTQIEFAQQLNLEQKEFMPFSARNTAAEQRSLQSPLHCIWQGNFVISDVALLSSVQKTTRNTKFINHDSSTKLLCATADILRVISVN